jgi:hypothetical protein
MGVGVDSPIFKELDIPKDQSWNWDWTD